MFRRLVSGLPKDFVFLNTLEDLGYFVNEDDEIRSLADPNNYFHFHISKSERVNERQRFHLNMAIKDIVMTRLHDEGLETVALPLSKQDPSDERHVPILVSPELTKCSRVVLVLGDSGQELGILAHRVINRRGGINKGSAVSLVQDLKKQHSSALDSSPPGIMLANTGETIWWPEGKMAVDSRAFQSVPMLSAAHVEREFDENLNAVPQLETWRRNFFYFLDVTVPSLTDKNARIDIIAIGDSVNGLFSYMLNGGWEKYQKRVNSVAFVDAYPDVRNVESPSLKQFIANRCRSWIKQTSPANSPLSGPLGNQSMGINTIPGCPVYSSGEKYYSERSLIMVQSHVLAWLQEVALTPDYRNPEVTDIPVGDYPVDNEDPDGWGDHVLPDNAQKVEIVPIEEDKPEDQSAKDAEIIGAQIAEWKKWKEQKKMEMEKRVRDMNNEKKKAKCMHEEKKQSTKWTA